MKKKKINKSFFFLILALALYSGGFVLIPSDRIDYLKNLEYAEQDEYYYEDDDGEEREGLSLIRIDGLGKIFIYKDIYLMSVSMFVIAMVIGGLIFGEGFKTRSEESLKHIIFANCVLGVLLIYLTTRDKIWSTVFFWFGIIAAFIAASSEDIDG